MNEIKAYSCEHCNRYYKKTKKSVENHEQICFSNPKRKACQTCGNLELRKKDNLLRDYCHEFGTFVEHFVCECQGWEPKINIEELIEYQNKQQLQ